MILPGFFNANVLVCCNILSRVVYAGSSLISASIPPLVTQGPPPRTDYKAGQTVVLRCVASGQPEPR